MTFPVVVLAVLAVSLLGQAPPRQTGSAFEVASVKANTSGSAGASWAGRGSQLIIQNYLLRDIILGAFGLRSYQLGGGPDWVGTARFDIVGRAPDGVPRNIAMLRTLLTDRFQLKTHTETRQLPVYRLVLARDDRRFGPKLRTSTLDCAATRCTASVLSGRIQTNGYSMAQLAQLLTSNVDRAVIDRTGLTGVYDLELAWTPDDGTADVVTRDAPGLFTAIVEQLALKLEPAVGPVDVLVIDGIERPTED
jgi:uncharacterized protein (TIGR03435 family)